MIKVIVIDDHPIVREGLKRIIAQDPGMKVVDEAGDGNDASRVIRKTPCDVVVMDLFIPQKTGLDVLKEVRSDMPRLPVLIMSGHADDQYAIRSLRAGAAGYLAKEDAPAEVIRAIRKVVRGGKYITDDIAQKLAVYLESDAKPPHEVLSDREYQVFSMLALGKTVQKISEDLSLSVKTVSTYRARVLEKLDMKNNAELMRYAFKTGIVR
jgi:two-component system invasion response regulator UvrY